MPTLSIHQLSKGGGQLYYNWGLYFSGYVDKLHVEMTLKGLFADMFVLKQELWRDVRPKKNSAILRLALRARELDDGSKIK